MNACATYDDVNLILRIYDLRREEKLRQARGWFLKSFYAKDLDELNALCPPGSDTNAYFRMVVSYWDMVASFVTHGVLQRDIFFESNREMLLVWERVRDVVPALRERNKDPKAYMNLEAVSAQFIEWLQKRDPETYPAFSERVRSAPAAR